MSTVRLLLQYNALVDPPNKVYLVELYNLLGNQFHIKFASTPLYMACHEKAQGYTEIAVLLISLGADANYCNKVTSDHYVVKRVISYIRFFSMETLLYLKFAQT